MTLKQQVGDSFYRIGDDGPVVTAIQLGLRAGGFALKGTGYFGNATDTAVRAIQKRASIKVDGVVGAETADVVDHLVARVQPNSPIAVPASSVWGNRYVWAPVEALVLVLTLAAMAEAVWRRMKLMNRLLRFWLLFGLVVTTFSATAILRGIPSGPYSYPQFLADRVWLFLWLSIAGVIGFGFGVSKEVRAPTLTRKHLVLYSLLMIAHTAVPDWGRWTASNLSYRAVVVVLFVAWAMSAVRLRDDRRQLRVYGYAGHGSSRPDALAHSLTHPVGSQGL